MESLYLFAIPVEIALLILSYLDYPEIPVLRATHPWFHNMIPATTYTHLQLLEAEWTSPLIRSSNRYTCCMCIRMLPADRFAPESCAVVKDRGGMLSLWRYCSKCEDRKTQLQQVADDNLQNRQGQLCNVCRVFVAANDATGQAGWGYCITHRSHASQDIRCLMEVQ